jgi:predicted nucleic acid-binding protein
VAVYADTSGLAKLVVAEPETAALRAWIASEEPVLVASDLVRTELMRAARRTAPDRAVAVRSVLDAITLLKLSSATFETAGRLETAGMRSLDALHLASALELGDDLDGFLTYDDRLAEAARAQGMTVVAPS